MAYCSPRCRCARAAGCCSSIPLLANGLMLVLPWLALKLR
jgi:hypothetical protein